MHDRYKIIVNFNFPLDFLKYNSKMTWKQFAEKNIVKNVRASNLVNTITNEN